MKNELDLSNHSITVENLSDAIDGAYAIGYPIALSPCGVIDSQGLIAYGEREFITMAYDMLAKSWNGYIILREYKLLEEEIHEMMEEEYVLSEDPEDILDIKESWDVFDEIHREQFNEKCRKIRGITKDAADFCGLDPWNDMGALGAAVEAVMVQCEVPFHVYAGGSVQETMREYVDDYGDTGETEEQIFQELCIKIKTTFEADGYCLDTSTYRPYINIQQLADIVEKVVQNSQQPFVVQMTCGGPPDMMGIMRGYVTKYSSEQYLPEIYVVKS